MEDVNMNIHEFFKNLFDGLNYKKIYIAYEPNDTTKGMPSEIILKKYDSLKLFLEKTYPDYKLAFGGELSVDTIKEINNRLNADAYLVCKEALDPIKLDKMIDLLNY